MAELPALCSTHTPTTMTTDEALLERQIELQERMPAWVIFETMKMAFQSSEADKTSSRQLTWQKACAQWVVY